MFSVGVKQRIALRRKPMKIRRLHWHVCGGGLPPPYHNNCGQHHIRRAFRSLSCLNSRSRLRRSSPETGVGFARTQAESVKLLLFVLAPMPLCLAAVTTENHLQADINKNPDARVCAQPTDTSIRRYGGQIQCKERISDTRIEVTGSYLLSTSASQIFTHCLPHLKISDGEYLKCFALFPLPSGSPQVGSSVSPPSTNDESPQVM